MISKFAYLDKMLGHLLIFGLLLAAVNADGKFAVLQSPNSIVFQGEEPVPGVDVGDIVLAATGNTISNDVKWSGLSIVDPFNLPKKAVVALIEGVSIDLKTAKFEFPLEGDRIGESIDMLVSEMKATHTSICEVDYSIKHSSKTLHKCFGINMQSHEKPALPSTTSLSSDNSAAKKFLSAIADLNESIDSYLKLKESKTVEPKSVVVIRMSLAPIVKAYGVDSAQQVEAVELVKNALMKLQKAAGDSLFLAISSTSTTKTRSKRETAAANQESSYNLAEYYNTDYPVIFNIILWFMIVFGLSLLAISYAIGSMDPGKDSIIYRMTSTRMKKDN